MKFSKNILTLVFAVAMVCVFAVVAYAAPTLTIGTVEANPGEEVDITVDLSNGTGLTTLEYSITLPGDSTLVSITQGTAFSTGAMWSQVGTEARTSRMDMTWGGNTTDGLLDTFRITAPSEAGEYVITGTLIADGDLTYGPAGTVVVPGTITVKGAETPAATLTAGSQNLVLDGGINAKVYFNYDGTETVTINDKTALKDENGYYLAISVAPKDYATKVTYNAVAGDLNASYSVSVADIFDQYQRDYADDTKLMALVNALEVYCAQAAKYFPNGGTTDTVSADITNIAAPSISGSVDGITLNSTSLILKDKVTLRHYFNVAAGTDVAALGLTALEGDATHAYVEYANINVTELANVITTEIDGLTITFAPLAYASINEDANVANLVNALYNYYVAAVAFAG